MVLWYKILRFVLMVLTQMEHSNYSGPIRSESPSRRGPLPRNPTKPMFARARTRSSKLFWRTADLVCALLVIFYVLVDVFDLDDSNVCRIANHDDHSVMVGEADGDFRLDDLLELTGSQWAVIPLVWQNSQEFAHPRRAEGSIVPLSVAGRSHGDRGCRPESSPPGASPDHRSVNSH